MLKTSWRSPVVIGQPRWNYMVQPCIFVLLGGVGTLFFVSPSGGNGGLFWGRDGFLESSQAESSVVVSPSKNSRELFVNSMPGPQGLRSDMGRGGQGIGGDKGLNFNLAKVLCHSIFPVNAFLLLASSLCKSWISLSGIDASGSYWCKGLRRNTCSSIH